MRNYLRRNHWFAAAAIVGAFAMPLGAAQAQGAAEAATAVDAERQYNIPAGSLADALHTFSEQSGVQVFFETEMVAGKNAPALNESLDARAALTHLLAGTGLNYEYVNDNTLILKRPGDTAAGQVGQRQPGIEEIIVTGQKREERIQDVPIAISAFSAKDLEAQKLEGGFDLLKAIPNVTFSKTNFTSYNFQIRGVGTQSISATSDPGVAVSFNNVAIIQNRLFEQEYLDVERVEVLRGPQGTLYGRNATAGVINVISNKPEMGVWDGMLDVEVGNYNTKRLRGHFNMPIGDTFAIRGAYANTDREGYTFNSGTGNRVDGRDLWTGRLSLGWQPSDRLRADFIYERFEEQDDRLRTSKQLCHRDPELDTIGDTPIHIDNPDNTFNEEFALLRRAFFNQGCQPESLYSDSSFDTPNGLAAPFIFAAIANGNTGGCAQASVGYDPEQDKCLGLLLTQDPYGGKRQSRDLREIDSVRDPDYRAEADLFELNVDFDVTESLQFSSQTAYVEDETFSFQDFNRFNTEPVFADTSPLTVTQFNSDPSEYRPLAPGGVFCDPQIGCTDRLAGFDISQASAEQFSQEFRLQSSFSGPLNFSVGANYTEFEALVDYYIMFNILTAQAYLWPFSGTFGPEGVDVTDPSICPFQGVFGIVADLFIAVDEVAVPRDDPTSSCPYIDTNSVNVGENFEGDGHNYFRSKNPYDLESTAIFGELYWNIQDDLKLTAGLRYTDDRKTFTVVPTQLLLAPSVIAGGTTPIGYPEDGKIEQQWGEWTGRLVLDWQPVLDFTDETLVYGSFSRGYKGGGANPPTPGFATAEETVAQGCDPESPGLMGILCSNTPILQLTANEYEDTFEPEFINAYEVGTKNTLFGGAMTLNATAFYYDYTDYQVSQIRDRTAVNENFDAEMWGLELETVFVPSPNWQFLANIGYLKTKIGEGEKSIDIMNRTQGNPDYTLVKPWLQLPSNCVVPTNVAEAYLQSTDGILGYWQLCGGVGGFVGFIGGPPPDSNFEGAPYDVSNYDGTNGTADLNGGAGILADVSGNELPQSPNLTVTLGGQYSFDLTRDWRATTRLDYYWQDESYHRVYNTEPYDRLKSWSNTNLSFWVNNANSGVTIEAYVKNLFNQTPITGAFLNSDDTGLTTNVFMFDPRVIGVSIRKEW